MHPTERRPAEFMLDFPGEMASYSASGLAKLSGVSNATATVTVTVTAPAFEIESCFSMTTWLKWLPKVPPSRG